jgi:hypothetical protein
VADLRLPEVARALLRAAAMKRVLLLTFVAIMAGWLERDARAEPAGCNVNGCWPDGGGCNVNGCWPDGGGCNVNGCWPDGGGCNVNGCWGRGGGCNVNGCWEPRMRPRGDRDRDAASGFRGDYHDTFAGYGGDDDDRWGAVVASTQDGSWGWAIQRCFENAAIRDARARCNGNCSVEQTFGPARCGAIAISTDHAWGRSADWSRAAAESGALAQCRRYASGPCTIAVWACN